MSIVIYNNKTGKRIDSLCKGIWDLPTQIDVLQVWLNDKGINLQKDEYVADIGFNIRKNAAGGGAVLDAPSMKIMGEIGMDLYLSEYPNAENKQ